MKKILSIAFSLVLCVLMSTFAGGSQEQAESEKTVQIMHVWGNPAEKAIIDEIVKRFEEDNPDYEVEQLVYDSSAYHQKILQLLAGNNPPDIFISYPGAKTQELVDKNALTNLAEMWEEYNLNDYFSRETYDSLLYKDGVWNIPWVTNVNIIVYNKSIFEESGFSVPATLAELESICDALISKDIYPFTSGWKSLYRSAYPVEMLLPSLGGPATYLSLASLQSEWDIPVVRDMLAVWKKWLEKGYWYPDGRARTWAEGLNLLRQGDAAMAMIGSYAIPVLEEVNWSYGEDYGVFIFPQENPEYGATLTGPYDSFSVPQKAKHKEAAYKFLQFLSSDEIQQLRADSFGVMLNKNISSYPKALQEILDQAGSDVSIVPGFFVVAPAFGFQRINQQLMTDFYTDMDIDYFIKEADKTVQEYRANQ